MGISVGTIASSKRPSESVLKRVSQLEWSLVSSSFYCSVSMVLPFGLEATSFRAMELKEETSLLLSSL